LSRTQLAVTAFAALEALIRKESGSHTDYTIATRLTMRGSTRHVAPLWRRNRHARPDLLILKRSKRRMELTYRAVVAERFSSETTVMLSGLIHVCEFIHLVPGRPALSSGKPREQLVASLAMFKLLIVMLSILVATASAELPSKKYLNLAAIKTMIAAAEAEARKLHVEVTLCVVDESGNLLFLQKADAASLNTIQFAERKARHAAFYRSPSKAGADALKKGNVDVLAFPDFFPNQGGLPIQVDGQTVGSIAASGAKSEIDEAIAQAAIDALLKK